MFPACFGLKTVIHFTKTTSSTALRICPPSLVLFASLQLLVGSEMNNGKLGAKQKTFNSAGGINVFSLY